jgi:cytochrome c biogenesis protein
MVKAIKKTAEFLGSIRLAIALLIIITIISFFGIIIPQGLPEDNYIRKWGPAPAGVLLGIGMNHVFTAIWFYLLLLLFSVNILVCSLTRLWKATVTSLKKSFLGSRQNLAQCRYAASGIAAGQSGAVKNAVTAHLKKRRYAIVEKECGDGTWQVAARKGALKDVGSLVFHLSIIVLLIGGFIGSRLGYSITKNLDEGQVTDVPDRDFLLRCDWFRLETNPDGSAREYLSKLSLLLPDGSTIFDKVIQVNAPLSYRGIRCYQESYGVRPGELKEVVVSVRGPELPDPLFTGAVPFGTEFTIPGTGLTLTVSDFLPDFVIDMEARQAASRSAEPNNPAMRALLKKGADTLFSHWVFLNFPSQHARDEAYSVALLSFVPRYYTGIQVRKNPGVPLIWLGIIAMTLGIFAVFYLPKRSVWVFVEPAGEGLSRVSAGGGSNRAGTDIEKVFVALGKAVQTTLKQEP